LLLAGGSAGVGSTGRGCRKVGGGVSVDSFSRRGYETFDGVGMTTDGS